MTTKGKKTTQLSYSSELPFPWWVSRSEVISYCTGKGHKKMKIRGTQEEWRVTKRPRGTVK